MQLASRHYYLNPFGFSKQKPQTDEATVQAMMGWLGNQQGYLLATPAHVGGFAAGLLLQRPLLLWRYRKA